MFLKGSPPKVLLNDPNALAVLVLAGCPKTEVDVDAWLLTGCPKAPVVVPPPNAPVPVPPLNAPKPVAGFTPNAEVLLLLLVEPKAPNKE